MKGTALFFVFAALIARADTVTLVSSASMNGTVTFEDGWFRVEGRLNGKPWKSDPISPQIIAFVDFNSLDYNTGSPPVLPLPRVPEATDFEVLLKRGRSLKKGPQFRGPDDSTSRRQAGSEGEDFPHVGPGRSRRQVHAVPENTPVNHLVVLIQPHKGLRWYRRQRTVRKR